MSFCKRTLTEISCKLNVVVKMAEMALKEGEKTVGLQEDAQKFHDEGT